MNEEIKDEAYFQRRTLGKSKAAIILCEKLQNDPEYLGKVAKFYQNLNLHLKALDNIEDKKIKSSFCGLIRDKYKNILENLILDKKDTESYVRNIFYTALKIKNREINKCKN